MKRGPHATASKYSDSLPAYAFPDPATGGRQPPSLPILDRGTEPLGLMLRSEHDCRLFNLMPDRRQSPLTSTDTWEPIWLHWVQFASRPASRLGKAVGRLVPTFRGRYAYIFHPPRADISSRLRGLLPSLVLLRTAD